MLCDDVTAGKSSITGTRIGQTTASPTQNLERLTNSWTLLIKCGKKRRRTRLWSTALRVWGGVVVSWQFGPHSVRLNKLQSKI